MNRIIREKPHRLPREFYCGPVVVSFTACIELKKTAFRDDRIVTQFVKHLGTAALSNLCIVPVYCFMPDHLHVILQGQDHDADAWRAIVAFKQVTGFWFGRNCPEVSWQKDFHDHIIRCNEDLGIHIRYIVNNPVRRGIVMNWFDYPFTGAIGVDLRAVLADATTL